MVDYPWALDLAERKGGKRGRRCEEWDSIHSSGEKGAGEKASSEFSNCQDLRQVEKGSPA